MKIRILQLEGTGIDTTQYSVGDEVEAVYATNGDGLTIDCALIPDARGLVDRVARPDGAFNNSNFLLLPRWFEVVE